MAATLRLVAAYLASVAVAISIPTTMYALLSARDGWWSDLLQWWAPWSDATLFGTLTCVVHETEYYGAGCLARCGIAPA